jgi:hypothetical protein
MTDRDAYEEMSFLRPLDIDDAEFSPLVEEIRSTYRRAPDPSVEARHTAAMLEQAKVAHTVLPQGRRPAIRPIRLIARLGIVAAAFGFVTGGLALAGVDIPVLPDRASDKASEVVGEHATEETEEATEDVIVPSVSQLPENASDTAKRVQAVIETYLRLLHEGEISGCEFGAMVSAAARTVEPDTSRCDKDSDDNGGSQGSEASAKGKARAEEAKAAGRAKGEEASGGKANARGKSDAGSEKSEGQSEAGSENSGGGKDKAEEAKAAGQAKGEEASGGKANPGGKAPKD